MCSSLLAPKSAILLLVFNLVTSYLKLSDKLLYTMAEGEADEIYRVNKLLAIEDMDWSRQLSQAVSILLLSQNLHFQKILTLVTFPYNL